MNLTHVVKLFPNVEDIEFLLHDCSFESFDFSEFRSLSRLDISKGPGASNFENAIRSSLAEMSAQGRPLRHLCIEEPPNYDWDLDVEALRRDFRETNIYVADIE